MQRNINSLTGYKIKATDGEVGEVKEFYFDDETWIIRYLIIETGNWLTGKKVLLSPQALLAPSLDDRLFPVNLSKEQIRNCPDIDTDKPFSRQQEIELYQHYSWQRYGGGGFYAGGSAGLLNQAPMADETDAPEYDLADNRSDYDPHLRSTKRITSYHIHATDGDTGHVNDFIVDDLAWQITDLVIDTHNWIGGKKVLIPVRHVKEIQWNQFKIITDVSSEFIHDSPSFYESQFNHPLNA
jgi:sporulation protein YlmC with PRC-barrel domain